MGARKVLPVIFSIIGGAGVIFTSYLTAKATMQVAEDKKDEKLSKKDFIKKYWKKYIPALISGGATIASITSSCIIGKKTEASLSASAIALSQVYNKYKGKIKNTLGLDVHRDIMGKLAEDELKNNEVKCSAEDTILCHEEHIGWFETTREELAYAYADLNQRIQVYDYQETAYYVMLYSFVKDHNIKLLEPDKVSNEDLQWGWSSDYLLDEYSYNWVHMVTEDRVSEDGKVFREIIFVEDPILNPGNYGEIFLSHNAEPDRHEFLKADSINMYYKKEDKDGQSI